MHLPLLEIFISSHSFELPFSVFHFIQRTTYCSPCRVGLLAINTLNICLFETVLISLSSLKDNFARCRIFEFFSFSTLNMSSYCLLVSMISVEKLVVKFCLRIFCALWITFLLQLSRWSLCLWLLTVQLYVF